MSNTGSLSTPLPFGAGYTDSKITFIYLRARYYDPSTGQFLTIDPLVASTLVAYGYTGGNPLNAMGPLGLLSWKGLAGPLLGGVSTIAGATAIGLAFVPARKALLWPPRASP
ncbi:MAG: tRNA nuclease WapA [Modestobacter sp.]|jgi:RHS repeat-associated protein|nr:tRNA nuclease WapA [Modestobacter sp.]